VVVDALEARRLRSSPKPMRSANTFAEAPADVDVPAAVGLLPLAAEDAVVHQQQLRLLGELVAGAEE
jgi:hypothetical protein